MKWNRTVFEKNANKCNIIKFSKEFPKKNRQTYFNVFLTYFIFRQKDVRYGVLFKIFHVFFNSGIVSQFIQSDSYIGKLDRSEREIPILTCFFSLKFSSRNRLMVMTCSSVKVWYSILVDCSVCSRFCTSCNFT